MAVQAHERCGLDKVLFMPCGVSPHKSTGPQASDEQRCRMLELALAGVAWAVLDRTDLEMPKPSWSWRLAEHMKKLHPRDELFWLMGKDQWDALEKWGRWRFMAELVTIIVYHRGGEPAPRDGVNAIFIAGDEPASSTAIREAIKRGEKDIPYLAEEVEAYVKAEGVYGVRGRLTAETD